MSELNNAIEGFKSMIIQENGEDFYYKLIAKKVKYLRDFKIAGDFIFGKNDEMFKDEVIKATLIKNKSLSEEEQLFELVLTETALDVFIE